MSTCAKASHDFDARLNISPRRFPTDGVLCFRRPYRSFRRIPPPPTNRTHVSPTNVFSSEPYQVLASYVTASAATQETNPAVNVVDGSLDTRWSAEVNTLLVPLKIALP